MNIDEINKLKNSVFKISDKGFMYFFKNICLIILILLGVTFVVHPEYISDPKSFIDGFTPAMIWPAVILFFIVGGIYQLAKSIQESDRKINEQKINADNKEKHNEMVKYRISVDPYISNTLKDLLINTEASRACIFEMHNGTNNLSGIPFLYADMTYEEVENGMDYVSDEFSDFNLTKYPFFAAHYDDGYWFGNVDDIEKVDRKLAYRLRSSDSNKIAVMVIHGGDTTIGFMVVAFKDVDTDVVKDNVLMELSSASQKVSAFLSKTK